MAASAAQPALQVPPLPPLPPKLRREPQRSSIGSGLFYASEAAFEADYAAWLVEQRQRQSQVKERERVRDQLRDRSQRQRGTEAETDSQRRVRQKREKAAEQRQLAEGSQARMSALLVDTAPVPSSVPLPAPHQHCHWSCEWSEETPALVMDRPTPVNHDAWWMRLEKHGFVAGFMLTRGTEQDHLNARARDRRHSV